MCFTWESKAQNLTGYTSGTTELIYASINDFVAGVNSGTLSMTISNLNRSKRYYVYVRTTTAAFVATPMPSPSVPNLALNNMKIEALSLTPSISPAITNITRNTVTLAQSSSSTRTGTFLLAAFTTANSSTVEGSSYTVTLTYRLVGPTNLCVAGNTSSSPVGLAYGAPVALVYDLDESNTNGSSTSWQDQNNTGHSTRIRVKDALEFTVNNTQTEFVVYLPSSSSTSIVNVADQFTIRSNENVSLTVISQGSNLTSTTTTQTIPVSNFDIKINTFTNIGGTNTYNSSYQQLSGSSTRTLATSLQRHLSNNISMSYQLANPSNLNGRPVAIYTTSLLFTVSQL